VRLCVNIGPLHWASNRKSRVQDLDTVFFPVSFFAGTDRNWSIRVLSCSVGEPCILLVAHKITVETILN